MLLAIISILIPSILSEKIILINDDFSLSIEPTINGLNLNLSQNNQIKLSGTIGVDLNLEIPSDCNQKDSCEIVDNNLNLTITSLTNGFNLKWITPNKDAIFKDCYNLDSTTNWYGGPEETQQYWPIENHKTTKKAYYINHKYHNSVAERYWLNSQGVYIFVNDNVPLFFEQNDSQEQTICFIAQIDEPYVREDVVQLNYNLHAFDEPRTAHLDGVNRYLGKPQKLIDTWIIENPIWTTWAKYKHDISDQIIWEFAESISKSGFKGQIEIDDRWENCYGSLQFDNETFGDIKNILEKIKNLGFTTSLWTHPFVNKNCDKMLLNQEYFLQNSEGSNVVHWGNGDGYHIDYTKKVARDWVNGRLKLLQKNYGIDTFKFDDGEVDFTPQPINYHFTPNELVTDYVRNAATFGGSIEVRTSWRTQNESILVRMLDKDTKWGSDNGLRSLIPTLLQFNLNGYTFVLPDMVGGNGYDGEPSAELLARWIEANTFMPIYQFSYLPWDIADNSLNGLEILQKFLGLHQFYQDEIIKAMNNSIDVGTPVNPPIWWVDPTNQDALKCGDEYLLGEKILVAPILSENTYERDIVIPAGEWLDGNTNETITGPVILENYPAPIDVLPYFIKV